MCSAVCVVGQVEGVRLGTQLRLSFFGPFFEPPFARGAFRSTQLKAAAHTQFEAVPAGRRSRAVEKLAQHGLRFASYLFDIQRNTLNLNGVRQIDRLIEYYKRLHQYVLPKLMVVELSIYVAREVLALTDQSCGRYCQPGNAC